jgi:hypothetical protein
MTLIEILAMYRDLVHNHGRDIANTWLQDVCEEDLWDHIVESVSDEGAWIDAEGYPFNP